MATAPTGPPTPTGPARLFTRSSWREARHVARALRTETVGGVLLLLGAGLALVWANSPWRESYAAVSGFTFGPAALQLDLDVAHWAADGLLALFFLVAGIEVKRELVVGDLRDPARAAMPVLAAVSGVAVPALIYLAVTAGTEGAARGWAIPTATDIAFALAVLAVMGTHLPSALRAFLLTLAVVDDLIAITIIAIFYTDDLAVTPLLGAVIPLAVFAVLVRRRVRSPWVLVPLGLATWTLVHASGVHATVAGVLLGLAVPVVTRPGEEHSPAERMEHALRPLSAGVAVPVFALFAAGVSVSPSALGDAARDPAAVGVALGLVLGKLIGILGSTWLLARFTRARLDDDLAWWDVVGVSLLAGIGFTVSLLVGDLAFGATSDRGDHVKVAVLAGSLLSALLAAVVLRRRNATYRRIHEAEARDDDGDGVPDVFQDGTAGRGGRGAQDGSGH